MDEDAPERLLRDGYAELVDHLDRGIPEDRLEFRVHPETLERLFALGEAPALDSPEVAYVIEELEEDRTLHGVPVEADEDIEAGCFRCVVGDGVLWGNESLFD